MQDYFAPHNVAHRILMCRPDFFEVCYVINPWMNQNEGQVNATLAKQQWQNLYQVISQHAQVILVEPVSGLPDMVFTANAGLVRQGQCIVSTFRHPQRKPEAAHFAMCFRQHGFNLLEFSQPTVFEGAGDALFDSSGYLWMGTGFRSEPHALAEISHLLQVTVLGLNLVDPRWYHLDTAFCPLSNGYVMAYKGAFSDESVALIESKFAQKAIWVSEHDALHFACNAVNIGQTVILHQASDDLKQALNQRGFQVIENNVSEFIKAGGACKCLTLAW